MSAVTGPSNLPEIRKQALYAGFDDVPESIVTTTTDGGGITVAYSASGLQITIQFYPDGSIVEIFGPPLNYTRVTSFGPTTITEVLS